MGVCNKSKKAYFPNSLESFITSHLVSYSYSSLSLEFDYKQLLFKKKKSQIKSNQNVKETMNFEIKKQSTKYMHTPKDFFVEILVCS